MNSESSRWLPYDWFKLTVAILLILLLLSFGMRPAPSPAPSPTLTPIPTISPTVLSPTLTAPAPILTLDQPTITDLLTEGLIEFSGSADPGATIQLIGNDSLLGSTTASASGGWEVSSTIIPGDLEVIARTIDASGNLLAETAPLSWQVASLAQPLQPPTIDSPTPGQALTAGPIEFSGSAPAGAQIELTDGNQILAETTASDTGDWTVTAELPEGDVSIIAQALIPSTGESAASSPLTLHINPALTDASGGESGSSNSDGESALPATSGPCGQGKVRRGQYIVAACENLTKIARRLGISLQALLAANPQVTNPDLIYPNQVLNLPATDED